MFIRLLVFWSIDDIFLYTRLTSFLLVPRDILMRIHENARRSNKPSDSTYINPRVRSVFTHKYFKPTPNEHPRALQASEERPPSSLLSDSADRWPFSVTYMFSNLPIAYSFLRSHTHAHAHSYTQAEKKDWMRLRPVRRRLSNLILRSLITSMHAV